MFSLAKFHVLGILNVGLGETIINSIQSRRDAKRKRLPGDLGKFWRDGGNSLLYDLPVKTGDLVIDAGGYRGDWSSGMISRYGCKCEIYEPIPDFAYACQNRFDSNDWVTVHAAALGGACRKAKFSLSENSSSEHSNLNVGTIEVDVIDVAEIIEQADKSCIGCLKLNIEGGEYEVLERLLQTRRLFAIRSLLVQFHRQPDDYEVRYNRIVSALRETHVQNWCYKMVWEKWTLLD